MKTSDLINVFWEDYIDEAGAPDSQKLFSPASIARRLNQAQREAANRALLIQDAVTPRICEITLIGGQADYALDRRVIKVNAISLQLPSGKLVNLPAMPASELARKFGLDWRLETGQPAAYEPRGHSIRLCWTPSQEYAGLKLKLDVYRYPMALLVSGFASTLAAAVNAGDTTITLKAGDGALLPPVGDSQELHLSSTAGTVIVTGRNGDVLTCLPLPGALAINAPVTADSEPEIPASMQEALLHYVASKAYLKRDADVQGRAAYSPVHDAEFARAFGPPVDHSKRMHQMHNAQVLSIRPVR